MILDLTQEDDNVTQEEDDNDSQDENTKSYSQGEKNLTTSLDFQKERTFHLKINETKTTKCEKLITSNPLDTAKEKNHSVDDDEDDDDLLLFSSPVFKQSTSSSLSISSKKSEVTNLESNKDNNESTRRTNNTTLTKTTKSTRPTPSSSSSAPCSKPSAAEERKKKRQLEKEKKEQLKAEEKEKKELLKAEREMAKQIKIMNKKRLVQQEQQANGKFSSQEIGVYMEEGLSSNEDFGGSLIKGLQDAGYSVAIAKKRDVGGTGPTNEKMIQGCIQWVRRDHLLGGATNALESVQGKQNEEIEWMDVVAIVFYDCTKFFSLLEQEKNDIAYDEYPLLQSWLHQVRSSIRKGGGESNKNPRIILVLHQAILQLTLQWTKGGKRRTSFSPTNEEELQDAITWLLMEEQVECEITANSTETIDFVTSLTRALSELPYYENATELHCVKKLKVDSKNADPLEKARSCWKRQLQQIPGMSEAKATYLTSVFPTARSLMEKYEDDTVTETDKRFLLSHYIQEGRNASKMSDSIYRLMTGTNEMELI